MLGGGFVDLCLYYAFCLILLVARCVCYSAFVLIVFCDCVFCLIVLVMFVILLVCAFVILFVDFVCCVLIIVVIVTFDKFVRCGCLGYDC